MLADLHTPLVGREPELARLRARLEEGMPVVTLTGPPGVGKSRLAGEVAGTVAETVVCELVSARDEDDVLGIVGRALGLELADESSFEGRRAAIAGALHRVPLVILDNVEHLIAILRPLIRAWAGKGPSIVLTSRESLGLGVEALVELRPLAADAEGPAVALFLHRAARLGVDPLPTPEVVASIVELLDGLPLAIELAASRSRVLPPAELLQRMSERFTVLRARRSDLPWSTLYEALDWSWQLLSPTEREALVACSVFEGDFDLAAAEAVLDRAPHETLTLLEGLRDKSMLTPRDSEGRRLCVLRSVREFALSNVDRASLEVFFLRHAERYVAKAAVWTPGADAGRLDCLRGLRDEQHNLRAVVERFLERPERNLAVEALVALAALAEVDGVSEHLVSSFDRALTSPLEPRARSKLLLERSALLRLRGQTSPATRDASDAYDLASANQDDLLAANALRRLGMLAIDRGELALARQHLEDARVRRERSPDPDAEVGLAIVDSSLARACYALGDLTSTESHARRALEPLRRHEIHLWAGVTHGYLAYVAIDQERYTEARMELDAAISCCRSGQSGAYEAAFRGALASLHHTRGDLEDALEGFVAARDVMARVGRRRLAAIHEGNIGVVLLELGRAREARARLERSAMELREVSDEALATHFSAFLVGAAISLGHVHEAGRLLSTVRGSETAKTTVVRAVLALMEAWGKLVRSREAQLEGRALEALTFANEARMTLEHERTNERSDVRIAWRIVDVVRRRLMSEGALPVEASVLRVDERGRWFEYEGTKTELGGSEVLGRLLAVLARARVERPGAILTVQSLIEATWPGERMSFSSAKARLHANVRRLRRGGLGAWLEHADDGYRLSAAVPVVVESAE
jgi:predicted ATPase